MCNRPLTPKAAEHLLRQRLSLLSVVLVPALINLARIERELRALNAEHPNETPDAAALLSEIQLLRLAIGPSLGNG